MDYNYNGRSDDLYQHFLAKFDTTGKFKKSITSRSRDLINTGREVEDIGIDGNGNIIGGGDFRESLTFGNAQIKTFPDRSINDYEGFLVKFDKNFNVQWLEPIGGISWKNLDRVGGVHVESSGKFYATGNFVDSLLYRSNGFNGKGQNASAFIGEFQSNGKLNWLTRITTNSGGDAIGTKIVSSPSSVFAIGQVDAFPASFGNQFNQVSGSYRDLYITKLDKNGNFKYVATGLGRSSFLQSFDIAIDSNKSPYVTGSGSYVAKLADISIYQDTIPDTILCAGQSVQVPFTVEGDFNKGNTFTAQLSNDTGNFDNPISIGSIKDTVRDTIQVTIPDTLPHGTRYKMRIVSDSPRVVSDDNGQTYTIYPQKAPNLKGASKTKTGTSNGRISVKWPPIPDSGNNSLLRLYHKGPSDTSFSLLKDSIRAPDSQYTHKNINTKTANHQYYLTAIDSCGFVSDSATTHQTMKLTFEVGQLLHDLSWTPYEGWPVQNYLVQRKKGESWQTTDSLSAGDTAIKKVPEPCNTGIPYRIKAVNSSGNFTYSDTAINEALDTINPDPARLNNVSFIRDSIVKIQFTGADSLDIFSYDVMRKQGRGNFQLADRIIFDSAGGRFTVYDTLNTAKDRLCYQILTQDSCLNTVPGDTFCPAYLTGKPSQLENQLSWQPFTGYAVDSQFLMEKQGDRYDTLARLGAADSAFLHDSLVCNNAHTYRLLSFEKGGSRKTLSNTLTLIPFDTVAPPSPTLRYVSVKAKDKVKVAWNWDQQSDQKYFEVWRDRGRGNFQLLDTVVYDTTYTDTTANPSAIAHHYYIVAADSCSADNRSIPSDTGRILQPSVTTGGCRLENRLSWNAYEDLPEGTDYYEVYKAEANGTFRRLKEVTQLSYADTAVKANQKYCYRLRAVDTQSGYRVRSAAVCQKPKSYGAPDTLNKLEQVTVTETGSYDGKVKITWKRPVEADDADYTLYRKQGSEAYQLLDTMSGNSYLDKNLNTKENPYTYRLKTVDSCDNLSDSFSTSHKTINLKANGSEEAVILSWNAYKGRTVSQYQVIRGSEVLYTISGEQTFLRDEKVVCDTFYNYQVRALMEGDTSIRALSNTDSAKATDNTPPNPIYLQRASVTTFNDVVELKWQASEAYDAQAYQIYRRNENSGDFNQIAQVKHPNTTYQDSFPINNREVCYFVKVKDACGNRSEFSNRGCIIQPEGEALDLENALSWPPYEQWQKGTRTYEVFKQTGDSTYQSLARLDSSQRSYLDQDLRDSADQFCYFIRAKGFGEETFSRSTRLCLEQSAIVHIPNTFSPGVTPGLNDQFGPEGLYIANYEMQVYNRWGEEVFSTSTSERWDGTYRGELVPQGVYHYQIVVKSEDGSQVTYEGQVTVIR